MVMKIKFQYISTAVHLSNPVSSFIDSFFGDYKFIQKEFESQSLNYCYNKIMDDVNIVI